MTLPTLPALVAGQVSHQRSSGVRHGFRHEVYQWLIDVDALPEQPWYLRPFAHFSAGDHLGDPTRSIRENVEYFLSRNGVELGEPNRIIMLANARVLGHVFDPLSVFWCLDDRDRVVCIIAEVHNTYGERHAYLLRPDRSGTPAVAPAKVVARADKALHVSPFFDVTGRYELRFELSPRLVSSTVILRRNEAGPTGATEPTRETDAAGATVATVAFTATFRGRPTPATRKALARQLIRKPLMPQQVSALIRMHGVWLWLRRLPVLHQPQSQPQEGV